MNKKKCIVCGEEARDDDVLCEECQEKEDVFMKQEQIRIEKEFIGEI